MTDYRSEDPGESGAPVPRDLPDQQAGADAAPDEGTAHEQAGPADDVPDTDEAGTRRRGAEGSDTVHPEHPDPDESPA
ncbi:hypothetical protein [Streptomyces sp. NPDC049813]|uniref:hypothetical protein n=1 Tax=Streptomyces sp. NPDC049813 TaxID=3365597 RepID=UPI0037931353